ncbi:MAG TPA: LysR family transcriptional regulator [Lacrimispora saccharolytica]|nr:LysR family transcriptional regulator [Lacrimispora saccharolytica]
MNVNLEYYRVFYQAAVTGSITLAAEHLCISQPAVSQAVRHLEGELGTKLFLRTPKGVRLTREGEMLYVYVKRGIESIRDGEEMLKQLKCLDTGVIRIGASDMTLQFYLLPYLEQFHEQYPKIKVMVSNGPTPETIDALENGGIDFGIVSTPFDERNGLCSIPVKEIENIFIAGNRFRGELEGRELEYGELQHYPCIFLEKKTSTRRFMDSCLEREGICLEPEFELATSDMIVQFVKRNLGIGCLMSEFAGEALRQEDVFALRFRKKMEKRSFCLITSSKNPLSPAAQKLLKALREGTEKEEKQHK